MAMRSQPEIRQLVEELTRGFPTLRDQGRLFADQLYATSKYENRLVAGFPDRLKPGIPLPSRRLSIEARHAQGLLAQDISHHIEPAGMRKKDEKLADRLEVFFAHQGLELIKPIAGPTARMQATTPFAAWWLAVNAHELPEDESKREGYRSSYERYRLELKHYATVSFLADDNGVPTVGAIEADVPYIDLVKLYGGKKSKDKDPLLICDQAFPFLRGGRSEAVDASSLYTKKAKVWQIADSKTIAHYVQVNNEYHQVGYTDKDETEVGDYPHWFGRCPLFIVTGAYNPDAEDMENRYEPLLQEMARQELNLDVMLSYASSIVFNPPRPAQTIPEAVALAAMEGDMKIPAVELKDNEVAPLVGTPYEFKVGGEVSLKDLIAISVAERDAARIPAILTNPDESTVKDSTAAAYLNANESANRILDAARNSFMSAVRDVYLAIAHDLADWGKLRQENLRITITGKELVKGKYVGERIGEEVEISPDDFEGLDLDKVLEVLPGPLTDSQKRARYEITRQQVQDGVKTPEQLVEVDTEDVTGQVKQLETFRRYQLRKPMIEKFGLLYDIEFFRQRGFDFSFLYLQTPEGAQTGQALGMPGNGMNIGPTAQPPAMSVPGQAVGL